MNLANLDLNLLVSLDALLQQRGVTRAAQQLGLSQPALSASLARLRRHFGDDLLARSGNEYRLTPLAVQLKPQVRLALRGVERVFTAQPEFAPAESTREFCLVMSDYAARVIGGTVARLLAEEAPSARLRYPANTPDIVDRADQTLLALDAIVMPHGFLTDLPHVDLYRDTWVCVVSADNTAVGDALTVEQLTTMPWVASYQGPTSATPASRQMRQLGIEPRIQVTTENFLTVPALVAGTSRIALMQRRLVDLMPADSGLRALACPFDAGPLVEALWWAPAFERDPEHLFFRDLVVRAAAEVTAQDPADAATPAAPVI